jgi:hypothetical protein
MRTGGTVTELGLYSSECCSRELIFDVGDTFLRCPDCHELCEWELEDELVSWQELERVDGLAA